MEVTQSASTVLERMPNGCPVKHLDFTPWRPMGEHWDLAKDLRQETPHFVNTYGDGSTGYWVFTQYDAVRDIYKTPQLFSSESITPWEPNPIYRFVPTQIDAPEPHQVPQDPEPVVLARRDGRAERPRSARSASGSSSRSCRGQVRLRQRIRAAVSDRGVPQRDRRSALGCGPVPALGGSRTSSPASAAIPRSRADDRSATNGIKGYWAEKARSARVSPSPRG